MSEPDHRADRLPTGSVRRAAKAANALAPGSARFLTTMAANLVRSPERAAELLERRHERIAAEALDVLGELRGGAMKIGQLASFVDVALLPPQFRDVYQRTLAELRDRAPPMRFGTIRRVLEEEWDEPLERLFDDFEHDAAAAASIGQVHRAVLADGRRVAVKVQYPKVAEALAADLGTAAGIATVVMPLSRALMPGLEPRMLVREVRELVLEEVDYELEAQHQRAFARAYRGHPFIHVPAVVTELSRRRVLVSEWVDGRRFDEMAQLPQAERDRIGEILQRFYLGAINRIGRYNTDSHPGNYLLRADGRMTFLDFGSVKVVDRDWLATSLAVVEAAIAGDAERLLAGLTELGYVHRAEQIDADALLRQTLLVNDWWLRDRELTIDPDYVAGVVRALSDPRAADGALRLARNMKIPPDEIWFRRVQLGVLAVLGQLRARGNWHRVARELEFGEEPVTALGQAEAAFFGR